MLTFAKLKDLLRQRLAGRWTPLVVAAIACILVVGSVGTGLQYDDYLQRLKLKNYDFYSAESSSIMEMFSFANTAKKGQNLALMEAGSFPWWTNPGLHVAFFRPIAAMTHWLDYQLWPDRFMWMHLHSIVWFGAMVFMAAMVYRRFMSPIWVAGLAALLFALDDAHGVPVGWIANRYVLMSAVFGCLALYTHDRWRKDGWRQGAVLGPALFFIALFSGESGLAVGAYIFSYEIFLSSDSWRKKALAFLPYAICAVFWWVVYHHLGYGSEGGGQYTDPGQTPLAFIRALMERFPMLMYGQWFIPDSAVYNYFSKPAAYFFVAGACVALALLLMLFWPLLKRNAVFRFWALGMALSALPMCATIPNNRLLIFVGLGAMGMLAQFLAHWMERPAWWPASRPWQTVAGILAVVLIFVHLIAAPLMLPVTSIALQKVCDTNFEEPLVELAKREDFSGKTLIFLNPPITYSVLFMPDYCEKYGIEAPVKSYVLTSGKVPDIAITRTSRHSFEMESSVGFLSKPIDTSFRAPSHPMRIGQKVQLRDMTAEVLSLTEDQRPLRVRFSFSRPLADQSLAFYEWRDNAFNLFRMPPVGQTVSLGRHALKNIRYQIL